eukprot:jgi/Tetstr1/454963/TSEL_041824.t1
MSSLTVGRARLGRPGGRDDGAASRFFCPWTSSAPSGPATARPAHDYLKNAKSAFWTFTLDVASSDKIQAVKKAVERLGLMDDGTDYKKWYDYLVKADVIIFPYKSDPWFSKNKGRFPSYKDKL